MQGESTIKSGGGTHVGQLLYPDYGSDEGFARFVILDYTIQRMCLDGGSRWQRSAALSKILFIYIAIEIFIRFFSQKALFLYDKWGPFTFLPLKPCG